MEFPNDPVFPPVDPNADMHVQGESTFRSRILLSAELERKEALESIPTIASMRPLRGVKYLGVGLASRSLIHMTHGPKKGGDDLQIWMQHQINHIHPQSFHVAFYKVVENS